jgi:hypothetical protein
MPNATNISIARDDGTSITLVPVSSSSEKNVTTVLFRELNNSKPLMACVQVTLSAETMKSGVIKATRKLEVPIMEIIPLNAVNADGRVAAPRVSHIETDIRTRFHSPYSTPTERADSFRMASHVDCYGGVGVNTLVNPASVTAFSFRDIDSVSQVPFADINFVWPSA